MHFEERLALDKGYNMMFSTLAVGIDDIGQNLLCPAMTDAADDMQDFHRAPGRA
jgi:hypothetical protein